MPHLTCTARFVDRDMFMRYLGYGIGHKDQNKRVGLFDEADDQNDLEEDYLDLQNMARIASSKYVPPVPNIDTAGVIDHTLEGDNYDEHAEDLDSDAASDDYDFNGNL